MRYPLTFYVDRVPNGMIGAARFFVILIDKRYRDDEGVYQHELVHIKQFFMTLGLHPFLYVMFPTYRLWAEIFAFRKQLKYYKFDRKDEYAGYIATRYGLSITKSEVLKLL